MYLSKKDYLREHTQYWWTVENNQLSEFENQIVHVRSPAYTRVIQKMRRQCCCRAQIFFKKSNLTYGKIQNHIFYQQALCQLFWLSSLHYI